MRIGLFGFTFENANKGCEALTYAFLDLLRKAGINKDDEIVYFSTDGLEGMVKEFFPDFNIRTVIIDFQYHNFFLKKEIKNLDLAFDITYGDNFSDIYLSDFVYKTTLVKNITIKCKVPLVLLPQTYGPFKSKKIAKMAKKAIDRSLIVYSRDKLSIDYIKTLSKREVKLTTDLAFLLPYKKVMNDSEKPKLGLNISGLLWKGGFNSDNQFKLTVDYKKYIISIIEKFKDEYEIHLIPHVIETVPYSIDGDLWIADELCAQYQGIIKAPAFKNAVEAKSYISGMDVFVGARMHSTVAAFSSGVAVIPFSYSRKFEGLYGNLGYPYIVHGCADSTEEAVEKTVNWINDRRELSDKINDCRAEMDLQLADFLNQLIGLIREYKNC